MNNLCSKSCASLWIHFEVTSLFATGHSRYHAPFSQFAWTQTHTFTNTHTRTHTGPPCQNFSLFGQKLWPPKSGQLFWTGRPIDQCKCKNWVNSLISFIFLSAFLFLLHLVRHVIQDLDFWWTLQLQKLTLMDIGLKMTPARLVPL